MDRETELEIVRRAYAKRVMFAAGVRDRRVEAAFASVSREHFLGRGPWSILLWNRGYVPTPSRNPVYIYDDVLVGIVPERGLNNGQPSLHALLVASAAPRPGEHAVHVGAGLGYYTAILAHLVGRRGRVTAIEYDPALATKLAANFRAKPNVGCIHGDGTRVEFDIADVIYINTGATRPADIWLDRLADNGRLILPLTSKDGFRGVCNGADRTARRGVPDRAPRRGIPGEADLQCCHLSMRRRARRGLGSSPPGGLRKGWLRARHTALSSRRSPRGALLAARSRLVLNLRIKPVARTPEPKILCPPITD